uniref:Helitron helicase-like domain-containing protein n=1 Tax=Panagrolaimus davidi TaxID=227884 RepID=A0A914PJC7_9BILA
MAFHGDLSGITSENKPNATYQSMIDGELLYEYAIHRYMVQELQIQMKKMNFRLCFTRFKQTLADAANDYMRSNYGEILKPREKQYVEAERLIIRRKRRMRVLYDAGNHPGIDSLLRYSAVQAWRSTQPFEETRQDPRFNQ